MTSIKENVPFRFRSVWMGLNCYANNACKRRIGIDFHYCSFHSEFFTSKKQKTKVSRVSFYLYIKYFKYVFFVYVHFSISREYLIQLRVSLSHSTQIHELATKKQKKQQCIPVGCVPSAAVAVSGGRGVCQGGCLPRHPPEQND